MIHAQGDDGIVDRIKNKFHILRISGAGDMRINLPSIAFGLNLKTNVVDHLAQVLRVPPKVGKVSLEVDLLDFPHHNVLLIEKDNQHGAL